MFKVDIHTDGACIGNPGPGGFGAIMVCKGKEYIVRGYDLATTNNQMELMAVIEALKKLKCPCEVTVHTDSQYVIQGITSLNKWLKKKNLPNRDLWVQLIAAENGKSHKMNYVKVKGHDGEVYNERCDKIAKEQARKAQALKLF